MPNGRDVKHSRNNTSRGLVKKLLDNPQLPAYIANLETPVLGKLIRHVGLNDSQELMALATPSQLQELMEMEAWHNERPGHEESFDPDKFMEWVEAWYDMGPAFMAQKLIDVGDELLTLAFMKFLTVVDTEKVAPGSGYEGAEEFEVFQRHQASEDYETFDQYAVFGKDDEQWSFLRSILQELWSEDPALLTLVLGRCRYDRSILAQDVSEKDSDKVLHNDVGWQRESRRESQGYVTPLGATMFLTEARNETMENLLIQVGYDAVSRRHLDAMAKRRKPDVETRSADEDASGTDATEHSPGPPERDADWLAIDALLEREKIVQVAPPERMLAGPATASELYLQRALRRLGEHNPDALRQRLDEVVFLANILVAGSSLHGGVFTEAEAAKAVHATCNLGLEFCLFEDPWDEEATVLSSFLESEPGLVKAFRIGYHLIGQLPNKAIVAVVRELTSGHAQRVLRHHPWVQEQVARAFGNVRVQDELDDEALDEVKDIFDTLALVFDHNTCQRLRILCDAFPCFPKSLETGAPPTVHVDTRMRYLATPADLRLILGWLESISL